MLDCRYAADVFSTLQRLDPHASCLRLLPPLSRSRALALVRRVDAVVNSSLSEGEGQSGSDGAVVRFTGSPLCAVSAGQSGALLEAMSVGTPVIARDIPGNSALVDAVAVAAGATEAATMVDASQGFRRARAGLLFTTPAGFVNACGALSTSPSLRKDITDVGQKGAAALTASERRQWIEVLQACLSEPTGG